MDDDNSLTIYNILQKENQFEEDAFAILDACDDQNCIYNKEYIRRALYAYKIYCSNQIRSAVCLTCSFHYYEGIYGIVYKMTFQI